MKEADPQAALVVPIVLGKDEMNLAEYPLSILTHRVPRDRKTYSFTQRITDHQGAVIKQSWSVLGSDKYGLPTPYDDDVLIASSTATRSKSPKAKRSISASTSSARSCRKHSPNVNTTVCRTL